MATSTMDPTLVIHLKEIDHNDRRQHFTAVKKLIHKFDDVCFLIHTNGNGTVITNAVVNPSDMQIRLTYTSFKGCISKFNKVVLYKQNGVVYILPTSWLHKTYTEYPDIRDDTHVHMCQFDAKSEHFVGEIGRNKNSRSDTKQPSITPEHRREKCLKPRFDKSAFSLKLRSHTSRIGKDYDDRFSICYLVPLHEHQEYKPLHPAYRSIGGQEVDNIPYSVQASDEQENASSQVVHSFFQQHGAECNAPYHSNVLDTDDATAHSREPARCPEYEILQRRQESFSSWPHPEEMQDRKAMAQWGLFFIGPFDLVRCYQCGIGLKDWSYSDDPLYEHIRYSQHCQHLVETVDPELLRQYRSSLPQNTDEGQATVHSGNGNTPASASAESYRNPEYLEYNVRVSSFSKWPHDIVQTPEQLAEAGFFYTGIQDVVRCFACDGGLQRWDPDDDPWVEHAHWFPNCAHVRQMKGEEYINLIRIAMDSESENENEADVINQGMNELQLHNSNGAQHPNKESDDPIYTPAAQSVIGFGYSGAAVKMAIDECKDKGIRWKAEDLLNLLLDKEDQSEVLPTDSPRPESPLIQSHLDLSTKEGLLQERSILLSKLKCIRCGDNDINVLFLPCAHHKMCSDCVKDVTMCPICGKTIREKVKTFLS